MKNAGFELLNGNMWHHSERMPLGVPSDTFQAGLMLLHGPALPAEPSQAPFHGELPLLAWTVFHKANGK